MTNKELLDIFRKDYYDLGFCKLPIYDTPDYNDEIQLCFNDFLRNKLFKEEMYEEGPPEYDQVKMQPNDIVIDCGANIGLFTVLACDRCCKVYCFEPMKKNIETLNRIKILNPSFNFEVIPVALGDRDGEIKFFASTTNRGDASIIEGYAPYRNINAISTIPLMKIDTFVKTKNLPKVDFIKADIEGAEKLMLMGATETLKKFQPKLSICTYHYENDKADIEKLIKTINPNYTIIHKWLKLYAY